MPRQKEFDPEVALTRAMELFWHRGYEATTLRDLLVHMTLSRQSLYDTFGDKHTLFIRALERYAQISRNRFSPLFGEAADIQRLRAHFLDSIDYLTSGENPTRACLMTVAAMELSDRDEQVRKIVHTHLEGLKAGFRNALRNSRARGALNGLELERAAELLVCLQQGLGVMARSGYPPTVLRSMVETALASICNDALT